MLLAVLLATIAFAFGPAHAAGLLSGDADFKLLATLGFEQAVDGAHADGTRTNDYAWSMAWFKGKLYVGTGRFEVDPAIDQPPAGQIWAYTPGGTGGAAGTWARVYQAPNLFNAPREFGYRWMTQCNFRGIDYLFISTLGTLQGNILYTRDGVNFIPVSRAGFPSLAIGFRTTLCFTDQRGRQSLITSPVGQFGDADTFDSDRADNPIVLANADPVSGTGWTNYSAMRMGNPENNSFFSLHAAGGWLYAGVSNEVTGGQLWRTRGCSQGTCVPTWTKIIDRGGGRSPSATGEVGNKGFSDMMAHGNDLYLGISSPAADRDRIRAELWRLRPDDTFEVLIGEPRLNFGTNGAASPTNPAYPANLRCGLPLEDIDGIGGANDCPPTTRRGPGFGEVGSAATGYPNGAQYYFWRLYKYAFNAVTSPLGDDRLYLGTLHGGGRTSSGTNPQGFDLYATADGVDWRTVTNSGLGYPQQQGMRSIAASPYGLFVGGTHFPLGTTTVTEIRGANVWLGAPSPDANAPVTAITSPPSPDEGATLAVRDVTFDWIATDAPPPGSVPLTYAYRLDPVAPAFSAFAAVTTKSYSGLANGTYTFHVIAKDAAGNTEAPGAAPGATNRRTFTINAPDLPPTVAITIGPASPSPTGNVGFTWAGSDDVTPSAGLLYDRWLSPPQADPDTYTPGTTANFGGLADGAYTFHVRAKDGAGNLSAEVTQNFTVAIPPDLPPTVVITSGPAGTIATGSVAFTWAGSDDLTPPASLLYDRWLSPLQADPGTYLPGTAVSFVGLVDGAYTLHVRPKDGAGNVGAEVTQSFTVAIPPGPPATPSPATATLIGPRLIRVAWTDIAAETGYFVERCTEVKRRCDFMPIESNLAPGTTFLDNAVPAGTHTYRVRACNAAGCSGWATSNSVAAP